MWNLLQYKDNTALYDEFGNKITYFELNKIAKDFSENLKKRKLCFVLCDNNIASIIGYVSFIENGIVPLLINANIDEKLFLNLLNIYKPYYILSYDNKYGRSLTKISEIFGYTLFETEFKSEYKIYDELALLLTTSGSTGSPKLVRQSYKNIESNAKSIVQYLEIDKNERPITTLPMNYTYGLSIINSHLMVGATIYVINKTIAQKEFWEFFKANKITSIAGVPYNYEILDKLRFTKMDLPYLKTMTQAGGKISLELHKKFAEYAKENDKKFVVMYGQCEATARMGYLPPEKALEKIGSMGIAIPGGEFKLIDADGHQIFEPDVEGELVYEGDNVTLGYSECIDDLLKGNERNGALETGDMAKFDEDGYYYITGRKKRFLKVYGNRINLDELERLIKSKYNIDIAISGIDDHIYVFLSENERCDDIIAYAAEITHINQHAFKGMLVPNIPHTNSGKIDYKKLDSMI